METTFELVRETHCVLARHDYKIRALSTQRTRRNAEENQVTKSLKPGHVDCPQCSKKPTLPVVALRINCLSSALLCVKSSGLVNPQVTEINTNPDYLSTSPKTISMLPIAATTSAMSRPSHMRGRVCKLAKEGERM